MGVKTKAGILLGIYTASQFAGLLGDDSHKAMEKDYAHSITDASGVFDSIELPSRMSDYLHTLGFAGPKETMVFENGAFKILQQLNPEQKLVLAVLDYAPKEVIQYVNGDFQILPFPGKDGFPRIDPKKESMGKDTYKERKKTGFNLPFLAVASAAEDGIINPGAGDGIKYKPGEPSESKGYNWLDTPKNIAGWFGSVFGSWGDAIGNLLKLRSEAYAEPAPKSPSKPATDCNAYFKEKAAGKGDIGKDAECLGKEPTPIATAISGAGKDKSAPPGTTPKATITPKPTPTPIPEKGSGAVLEKLPYNPEGLQIHYNAAKDETKSKNLGELFLGSCGSGGDALCIGVRMKSSISGPVSIILKNPEEMRIYGIILRADSVSVDEEYTYRDGVEAQHLAVEEAANNGDETARLKGEINDAARWLKVIARKDLEGMKFSTDGELRFVEIPKLGGKIWDHDTDYQIMVDHTEVASFDPKILKS